MDRLTREEVEVIFDNMWRGIDNWWMPDDKELRELQRLTLLALSIESVRSEALEEAARICDKTAAFVLSMNTLEQPITTKRIIDEIAVGIRALQSREDVHSTELRK